MKKFIIKGLIFLCTLILIVWLISYFDNDIMSENNPNIVRIKNASKYPNIDYLFIGSSYTYSAIIPAILDSSGIKTYNYGIATAGPYFYEVLIDDYIKSSMSVPKHIVFDISLLTFSSKSDNWSSYPVHRYLNHDLSNEYISLKYNSIDKYFQLLQKSLSKGIANIFHRIKCYLRNEKSPNVLKASDPIVCEITESKGFEKVCEHQNKMKKAKELPVFRNIGTSEFDNKKAEYFESLILKYSNLGIEIIVIYIPTNSLKNFFTDKYKEKYQKFNEELRSNKNVKVIDVDSTLKLNDYDFRNTDHINCYGALKISRYICNKL